MRSSYNFEEELKNKIYTTNQSLDMKQILNSKSKPSRFLSSSNLTESQEDPVKDLNLKKPISRKKLKKIKFNLKTDGQKSVLASDSPFIHKKNFTIRPTEFSQNKKRDLVRADSFPVSFMSKESTFKEEKPKENKGGFNRNGILRKRQKKTVIEGIKRRMKVRHYSHTETGFSPYKQKVNQDRMLATEILAGGVKIKCFAVADGHGNFKLCPLI